MDDTRLPLRLQSHQLEELSRRCFDRCLPKNWVGSDAAKPGADYGADVRVDLFDGNKATGQELLVQLKASQKPSGGDSESIQLKTSTFNYLRAKLQVVMLVKYAESDNEAYWLSCAAWWMRLTAHRREGQHHSVHHGLHRERRRNG